MPSVVEIEAQNVELGNRIYHEARTNPLSPDVGKKVGIANGEVVVVADTWKEVTARLDEIQTDRRKTCVLDTSANYDEPQRM